MSFLIFFHLFALFVAVVGNPPASQLFRRLRIIPGPYLQLLGLDTSYRFYFTQGRGEDRGWIVEAELGQTVGGVWQPGEKVAVPMADLPAGLRRQRFYALISSLRPADGDNAFHKEWQDQLAAAIGQHVLAQHQAQEVKISLIAHQLLTVDEVRGGPNGAPPPADPNARNRFETVYRALVRAGQPGVIPDLEPARDTAPAPAE